MTSNEGSDPMSKASARDDRRSFPCVIFPSLVCAQAAAQSPRWARPRRRGGRARRPRAGDGRERAERARERGERAREMAERVRERVERARERGERGRDRGERRYEQGSRALDRREWNEAIASFDEVVAAGEARADGALYWKAYALAKLGRRPEALAALDELGKKHPQSRWLNDARVMRVEIGQAGGKPSRPRRRQRRRDEADGHQRPHAERARAVGAAAGEAAAEARRRPSCASGPCSC